MRARMLILVGLGTLALGSCSKDNPKAVDAPAAHDAKLIDAKPLVDAGPDAPPDAITAVETVACPTTPDAVVTISSVYVPMVTTITAGQIVKFTTPSFHDVTPNAGQDPGIHVGFSQAAECKKYTVAGTYSFHCSVHGFMGSVVVN